MTPSTRLDADGPDLDGPSASGRSPQRRASAPRDAVLIALGYLISYSYPLVSLPFLARVLGPHDLGVLLTVLALLQVIVFVTDFGFGMSSLRRAAEPRARAEVGTVARILAETCWGRSLLWAVSGGVLLVIAMLVPSWRHQLPALCAGLLLVLGGAWYPGWLLQAHGRVVAFAVIMASTRLIALGGLLLTVRTAGDLTLAVVWQLAPQAFAALAGWGLLIARWGPAICRLPTPRGVLTALKDAAPLFAANASAMVSGTACTLALGVASTPAQVAYFGAAERFGNAVRGVMRGVGDAMLARLVHDADPTARRSAVLTVAGGFAAAGLALAVFAPLVLPWYLGPEMVPAVLPTMLFGAAMLPAGAVAVLTLLAARRHRYGLIARIAAVGATGLLLACIPAAALGGAVAMACVVIGAELLQALCYLIARPTRQETP